MTGQGRSTESVPWRPVTLDVGAESDARTVRELVGDATAEVRDLRESQRAELADVGAGVDPEWLRDPGRWIYYPWRRAVLRILGPEPMRLLRLDRNRNKITAEEQGAFRRLCIGVVGLSVGHAVAHTLALEGLCGELRLADFDDLEVSNLNRVPGTLFDVGVNKAVVAARRIAELDPDLEVSVFDEGVTAENASDFLDGVDILIEECDSLDLKVALRERARDRRIPVLMETSDRGLLDVERFDLEPERPLFHGLLGDVDSAALKGLSNRDKIPHVMNILGAGSLSPRMAASLVDIGRGLATWPQLAGDVALGGATVAAAVRRWGRGEDLPSGRIRVDVDVDLQSLGRSAEHRPPTAAPVAVAVETSADQVEPVLAVLHDRASVDPDVHPVTASVVEAIRRAPSGGNVQPWRVEAGSDEVRLFIDREKTTTMDVEYRGSYVALGAALFNARTAASAAGALGPVTTFPDPSRPDLVAVLRFGVDDDVSLTRRHAQVGARVTNRHLGRPRPLSPSTVDVLDAAARGEGARLRLLEPGARLEAAASSMAAADRFRYLTPTLHREMISELVWPGDAAESGIETRSLGLDPGDLAKLEVARRPEVMALLAQWDSGTALGDDTRARLATSSALAVVTVDGVSPRDFVRGGSAVEAVWLAAEQEEGLAVHPMSPTYLFAVDPQDLAVLSEPFGDALAAEQASFREAVGLEFGEHVALVMRLSHTDGAATPSRRRALVVS